MSIMSHAPYTSMPLRDSDSTGTPKEMLSAVGRTPQLYAVVNTKLFLHNTFGKCVILTSSEGGTMTIPIAEVSFWSSTLELLQLTLRSSPGYYVSLVRPQGHYYKEEAHLEGKYQDMGKLFSLWTGETFS